MSGASCSLGLAIYLKSQRGAGRRRDQRLSDGQLSTLPLGEYFKETDGRELCSACILFIDPCHPKSCDRNNQESSGASLSSFSEQIWQEEAGRLGFNTVNPEVGTASMVLVPSIGQLETVCFRVECFFRLFFCRLLFFPAPGVHI